MNGLPPQVTVRTRSLRNQISSSPASLETRVAITPLATPFREREGGLLRRQRGRCEDAVVEAFLQPSTERADFFGPRNVADGLRLAFEQQRRAAGVERQQQRVRSVEQRAAPVSFARHAFDHALLQAAHRKVGLALRETLQRRDARAHDLSQQFADGAHFELDEARRNNDDRRSSPKVLRRP